MIWRELHLIVLWINIFFLYKKRDFSHTNTGDKMKKIGMLVVGMALGAMLCNCKCSTPKLKQLLKKINIQ